MPEPTTATPLKGPYDGQMVTYSFGDRSPREQIKARSLLEAVRIFRATTIHPAQFKSTPDGLIPVHAAAARPAPERGWSYQEVCRIPVEDAATEPADRLLSQMTDAMADSGAGGLVRAGEAPRASAHQLTPRRQLSERHTALAAQRAELERQSQQLRTEMASMEAELKRRKEVLWILGAYLGTSISIKTLREGAPAPMDTPITVRQRVLCMDEEIAVHRCLSGGALAGEGAFDNNHLPEFDTWVTDAPGALDVIFPWPKGVCALRVRRNRKQRSNDAGDIFIAMANAEEAMYDEMTYLLVRNGDQLYRVGLDADLWPRLLPSAEDAGPLGDKDDWDTRREREHAARIGKQQFAGMMAIQGLLAHTEILAPTPYPLDVMNPRHAEAFNLVRDDEGLGMLEDGSDVLHRVTWASYEKWLQRQVTVGSAVWYFGPVHDRKDYGKISERVPDAYYNRGLPWPKYGEVYTVAEHYGPPDRPGRTYYTHDGVFFYLPNDETLRRGEDGYMEYQKRVRRVSFMFNYDEVIPIHALSWRILRHLLLDRGQRARYADFFPLIQRAYQHTRALAVREAPFVNLVLARAGWDPSATDRNTERARARIERLIRWWKIKVKEQRELSADEPKALRMILVAFERGDDHTDDPEVAFLSEFR